MNTLTGHLHELRRRLILCVFGFGISSIGSYLLFGRILALLEHPYCKILGSHSACALYVTGPVDALSVRLDITAYGAFALTLPLMLFHLWRFITPGLKAHERRFALPFVVGATALFLLGVFVSWSSFPHALGFLHTVGGPGIRDIFSPGQYVNLLLALMTIFGITFEFPILLISLELAGVITPEQLSHQRRVALMVIVVVAAVITPSADPFSMLAMALPMVLLYELSIAVGRLARRTRGDKTEKISSGRSVGDE